MAVIRRHWRAVVVNLLIVSLMTGMLVYYLSSRPATADPAQTEGSEAAAPIPSEASSIDPVTYSQVQELRQQICLTNQDLAAMGATQANAEQVLTSLVSWYEQNKSALQQNDQAMLAARASARDAMRKMNIGPKDAQHGRQYQQASQAAGDAAQRRKQLLDAAIAALAPTLGTGQQAIWQIARTNRTDDRYRYVPNLTIQQVKALQEIDRNRSLTPVSSESARNTVLSSAQRSAISSALANQQQNFDAVSRAEETVLPLPNDYIVNLPHAEGASLMQ